MGKDWGFAGLKNEFLQLEKKISSAGASLKTGNTLAAGDSLVAAAKDIARIASAIDVVRVEQEKIDDKAPEVETSPKR